MEKVLLDKGYHATSIFISGNRLITCCDLNNSDEEAMSILNEIALTVYKEMGYKISICFSPYAVSANQLSYLYGLLIKSMRAHPFITEVVYSTYQVTALSRLEKEMPEYIEDQLNNMDKSDNDGLIQLTTILFQYFQENHWFLEEIVVYLKRIEEKLLIEFKDVLHFHMLHDVNVDIYNSYKQIQFLFLEDLKNYSSYRKKLDHSRQQSLAKQAVAYMNEHFSSDLKATEVADVINVSANYFSQLIKQETGQHFNDYLHAIRINHAKILLKETPYRIFEIANMVGYKDYKYFVHIFKKLTNITPSQYRNMEVSKAVVDISKGYSYG